MPTCCPISSAPRPGRGGANTWRGGEGPLGTAIRQDARPAVRRLARGRARRSGYPSPTDYNGEQQEGFGRGQYTIRDGRRSSSARAYLRPARGAANLTVETGAHATRVADAGHARDRRRIRHGFGRSQARRGSREVIVASGTFNSPQLLMLSGIGPAAHLREMGIACVADLPVGKNLQDHHRRLHDLFAQVARQCSTARCASIAWR